MENLQFVIIIIFSPLIQGIIKKFKAGFQGREDIENLLLIPI